MLRRAGVWWLGGDSRSLGRQCETMMDNDTWCSAEVSCCYGAALGYAVALGYVALGSLLLCCAVLECYDDGWATAHWGGPRHMIGTGQRQMMAPAASVLGWTMTHW